jgi:Protein of unknown function (DUF3822)
MQSDCHQKSHLSLELHPAYMAFAVQSEGTSTFAPVAIEMINNHSTGKIDIEQLSQWLKRHQAIWTHHFDKVYIAVHDIPLTIVSETDGHEEVLKLLSSDISEKYDLHHQALTFDWIWSFGIPKELATLLNNYFTNPVWVPGIHGFVQSMMQQNPHEDTVGMFVTPDMVHFVQIRDGKPAFYNSFRYTNKEDLLYFVLLSFQNLQMDPQFHFLHVAGLITENSPLYEMSYQYIRNIQLVNWTIPVSEQAIELSGFPAYAFINLTGIAS